MGLAVLAACLAVEGPASAVTASHRVRRLKLAVTPSPEIETRVEREVARARHILERLDPAALFDSPYLASAVYYHEGFLDDYPDQRPEGNPARRIIARVSRLLTPERRASYIRLLRETAVRKTAVGVARYELPVRGVDPRRRRRTHRFALDLFAAEGSPVRSASAGVVLLAEGHWARGDPFSTSSQEGGNSVIVFDPESDRFFRYCHLESISVHAGQAVEAGERVGAVGHTGANASRRGHGRHLHFEVNQWDGQRMRPLSNAELRVMVGGWRDGI